MSLPKYPMRMASNKDEALDFLNKQRRHRSCFSNRLGGEEEDKRHGANKPRFK